MIPILPIAPIHANPVGGSHTAPGGIELASAHEAADSQSAAAFARAAAPAAQPSAAQSSAAQALVGDAPADGAARPSEVAAMPVPGDTMFGSKMMEGAQDLSLRFGTLHKAAAAPAAGSPVATPAQVMEQAVSGMQDAYVFAIQTTMASRGSTETTKIFNTLLKGQ